MIHSSPNMISFEREIKAYFTGNDILFDDNTASLDKMDFTIRSFDKAFYIDAKEKRQKINTANWPLVSPENEPFTFIIDDLAARKALAFAPRSGLIVRDNLHRDYYWFSILDLFLMPKVRVNRKIEKKVAACKGKWLIDLRNAFRAHSLEEIIAQLKKEETMMRHKYTKVLACYGDYYGEEISLQGETRQPGHWKTDVNETR